MMVIDDAIQLVMNEALFIKTKEVDKMHANEVLEKIIHLKITKKMGGYIAP